MTKYLLFLSLLAVAACHKDEPPAPTTEQSGQLNEAEDMLNEVAINGQEPEQPENASHAP